MAGVLGEEGAARGRARETSPRGGSGDGGRPLRILHVITSLARGGAQAHLLELTRGQKRRGHSVEVAYFKDADMADDFVPAVGFPYPLGMERLASTALLGRLWGLVSAIRPDVLHTHLLKADAYGAVVGRFGAPRATISSKHNEEAALQRTWVARLHGRLSRWDDRIIVCSDAVGRYMVETGRVPAARVRRVYYGISLDRPLALSEQALREVRRELDLPREGLFLLCVGRLDPQKGHPYLFEAMGIVGQRFPDARLVVVGAPQVGGEGYVAALRGRAAEPDLAGRIVFAGERRDVARLMAACDLFVLSSLWEGFGLVFAEAMAASKPVVGTRLPSVAEVVADGETGLLVPPGDADALAQALVRLCGDPAERRRLGRNGYQRVRERFTASRMVAETLDVYREVLGPRSQVPGPRSPSARG